MRSLAPLFHPKPRINIWQWAERDRYLAKGVSAKSLEGPRLYSTADAPHQRAPQEAPLDPAVQVTVLVMASQVGGKTEIFNNILGYHMDHAPRNCVVMYPTLDAAEKYSKKKFSPMIDASPCLARLIKPARSRDSGNTILVKDFTGGSVFFIGANSPSSLRGASGEVLLGDEIDGIDPSANPEGDAVELLWKRAESFPRAIKLLSSTPTHGGRDEHGVSLSPIWAWFEESDQQYWHVPCAQCGRHQVLTWKQIVWPKDKPELTALMCSHCAAALNDRQRLDMYHAGEWRPTAPFRGIRGFHLSGIYSPWPAQKGFSNRLEQMAREHLRAVKKGAAALRVWTNTFLCETFEETHDEIDHTGLVGRAEDYTPEKLPSEIILAIAAVDVQKDRLECETIGLGEDDETWGIEFRKFYGDTEQDTVWEDLAQHLSKTYTRSDGVPLRITATAIDMRHAGHKVRKFVQKSGIPRVFAVYGAGGHTPLLVTARFHKHYRLRTHAVNGKIAKDILFARLKMDEPGPRYMHYPKGQGYNDDYFLQLTAEVLKTKRVRGVVVSNYEKIRDRNEALDIRVYGIALVDILKPNLTAIAKKQKPESDPGSTSSEALPPKEAKEYILDPEKKFDPRPEQKPETSNPKPPLKQARPPRPPRRPGGGWISGWKK